MDPFLYQYAIGGSIFGVGMYYAYKQGYVGTSGPGLRNLLILLGGLFGFAALQGFLQYAPMSEATPIAYDGPPLEQGRRIGTGLDYAVMVSYFLAILFVGTFFGQNQKDTKDFFFGGQRFSWWLIAFSLVATTIGSYSFVKYSKVAFSYGLASTQTYLNDWFWVPMLLFGWLPILYFSRLTSIPEYFEKRFHRRARQVVTWLLLAYLIGYVGVNLFTMGKALHILLGWDVLYAAILVATISAVYVTFGGQTSVIMTDLFQGVMLLVTGLVILALGAAHLGGFDQLWAHMPRDHRTAFTNFNSDPAYNSAGVFWQDGVANTAMFYFLNQGILMRFMAARSVEDGRKAAVAVLIVLMPIAAIVVASGGWVGRAFVHAGVLPADVDGASVFFITAEMLARPGVFGLIMASLTAALMSTVDSLITAIAAIVVNDVYQPARPEASQAELLRVARFTSVTVTMVGISLVPVFSMFDSIYAAHGAFTAAITPPMVVALLLGVFWRRYTPTAAMVTMVGGTLAVIASILYPPLVAPFAHGIPAAEVGDGILAGAKQYKYIRAFYGIAVSGTLGVLTTFFTSPRPLNEIRGYVWGTVADALRRYKGSEGIEVLGPWASARVERMDDDRRVGEGQLPVVRVSRALADALEAELHDLIYVTDRRAWLGGLRSVHGIIDAITDQEGPCVTLGPSAYEAAVKPTRTQVPVRVQRMY